MKGFSNKLLTALLVALPLPFLAIYLTLSALNSFALDDFHLLSLVREKGFPQSVIWEYKHWGSNWSAAMLSHSFLLLSKLPLFHLLYGCVNLLFLGGSIWYAIDRVFRAFLQPVKPLLSLALTGLVLSFLFFTTFDPGQTWFWFASIGYLWGVGFLCWGGATLLCKKTTFIQQGIVVFSFLYIGGSNAVLAIFVLIGLGTGSILPHKQLPFFAKPSLFLAFVATLLGFLVLIFGPGTEARMSFFETPSLVKTVVMNTKATALIGKKVISHLHFWFLYGVIFWRVGFLHANHAFHAFVNYRRMLVVLVVFFVSVFIYHLPLAAVMSDIGPDRALFPLQALIVFGFVGIMLCVNKKPLKKRLTDSMVILAALGTITLQTNLAYQQYGIAKAYAAANAERMKRIQATHSSEKIVYLKALPPAGWLQSAEISSDTTHYSNMHLKKFLGTSSAFAKAVD